MNRTTSSRSNWTAF